MESSNGRLRATNTKTGVAFSSTEQMNQPPTRGVRRLRAVQIFVIGFGLHNTAFILTYFFVYKMQLATELNINLVKLVSFSSFALASVAVDAAIAGLFIVTVYIDKLTMHRVKLSLLTALVMLSLFGVDALNDIIVAGSLTLGPLLHP